MSISGRVYLVGAGPGDPGYLTLRGKECLEQASLVIYDQLVSPRLLDYAPSHAKRVCVTAFADSHPDRWPHVHKAIIDAALQGEIVARLKGGDPLIFGRGAEEAQALLQAGIPYEIVPGVTAALGAAACTEIPLTHRDHSSAVAIVTGHENPAKPETSIDWANLAHFPGTLVIYMGMARLPQIVELLLKHGKHAQTPAAVVQSATTGSQHVTSAPLAQLPEAALRSGQGPPALVIVGNVVAARHQPSWFDQRPLAGQRVLICRPEKQGQDFARRCEQLGATAIIAPAIEIGEPFDWGPVDRAIVSLSEFDWLVFTSSNGVRAFLDRLWSRWMDFRAIGRCKIAAIGPGTARELGNFHLRADLVPQAYTSEDLADALKPHVLGKQVLLVRADRGRDVLRSELSTIAQVGQVAAYSQADVPLAPEVLKLIRAGQIDLVPLTSSNIARSFLGQLNAESGARVESGKIRLVSISPVTSAEIREMGFPVAAEAQVYTTEGLIQSMVELVSRDAGLPHVAEGVPGEIEQHATGKQPEDIDVET